MKFVFLFALVALMAAGPSEAQFFRNLFNGFNRGLSNIARPFMNMFQGRPGGGFGGGRPSGGRDLDETGGTKKPVATGIDNPFPDDCGRNEKGKGNLCFPDGLLCQNRKFVDRASWS